MEYSHPCDVPAASSLLFDVTVLAGGEAQHMSPLCDSKPKPLLPLCNRPLIWYTLVPLVQQGCTDFFIAAHTDDIPLLQAYLTKCADFDRVNFTYVDVPVFVSGGESTEDEDDEIPTDSADALRAVAKLRNEKYASESHGRSHLPQRDMLVVSCDVVLANVDLQPFVSHFYNDFSSLSLLMVKAPAKEERAKYHYKSSDACLTAMERDPNFGRGDDADTITHHRLHLHMDLEDAAGPLDLSVGYLARRPNMTFDRTMVDAHVYLCRAWVLELLLQNEGIHNIKDELVPEIAEAQLWKLSAVDGSQDPSTRLGFKVPGHWLVDTAAKKSVGCLNSMQDSLPNAWDECRVSATVYPCHPMQRIVRVNSKEKYKAISEEMVVSLLNPLSEITSPLAAMVARQLEAETTATLHGATVKAKGCALLSIPPPDAKMGRSVVGRGVKIGKKCKIQRSVIMDNAEVGDGTTITDSIICAGVQVAADEVICPRPGTTVSVVSISHEVEEEEDDAGAASSDQSEADGDDEFKW